MIDEPLCRVKDFHSFGESRTHSYHIRRHVKNNGRLIAIGGTAVNLGTFLIVSAGEKQSDSGGKLTFALFFWNFNIGGIKLPVAVGFQCSENITDNLLLPVDELKRLTCPCAFGVGESLDKGNSVVG